MTFDYSKFLSENQLTTTSRIKARFLNEEEEDAGIAAGKESAGKAAKLQQLVAQKDEILAKYKSGDISLDQYRTQIGNIPQQIKQLRLDMSDELNPAAGTDEEGNDALVTNQTPDKDTDVSGVEAGALQKMAGGTQYPDDMGDDEETAPSRVDMDYYQGDQDEVNEELAPSTDDNDTRYVLQAGQCYRMKGDGEKTKVHHTFCNHLKR